MDQIPPEAPEPDTDVQSDNEHKSFVHVNSIIKSTEIHKPEDILDLAYAMNIAVHMPEDDTFTVKLVERLAQNIANSVIIKLTNYYIEHEESLREDELESFWCEALGVVLQYRHQTFIRKYSKGQVQWNLMQQKGHELIKKEVQALPEYMREAVDHKILLNGRKARGLKHRRYVMTVLQRISGMYIFLGPNIHLWPPIAAPFPDSDIWLVLADILADEGPSMSPLICKPELKDTFDNRRIGEVPVLCEIIVFVQLDPLYAELGQIVAKLINNHYKKTWQTNARLGGPETWPLRAIWFRTMWPHVRPFLDMNVFHDAVQAQGLNLTDQLQQFEVDWRRCTKIECNRYNRETELCQKCDDATQRRFLPFFVMLVANGFPPGPKDVLLIVRQDPPLRADLGYMGSAVYYWLERDSNAARMSRELSLELPYNASMMLLEFKLRPTLPGHTTEGLHQQHQSLYSNLKSIKETVRQTEKPKFQMFILSDEPKETFCCVACLTVRIEIYPVLPGIR